MLEVELVMKEPLQETTPEPQSAPEPEPLPPPPKEIPKPRPEPEPLPKPKPIPKPEPIVEPPPAETPQEPVAEPAPPAVISTEPVEEKTPEFTAPPPPPKPPEPRKPTEDMDAARNQYGSLLAREIAKYKQYPRIAQMRGWQGETLLELQIDGNGKVVSSRIHTPSSYEVLDKQALEMVKRALPFPLPPAALRGQTFTLLVPIAFRLE